ncbi:MAG: PqqD family protein, partial [Phycisphaerae bacterium]
ALTGGRSKAAVDHQTLLAAVPIQNKLVRTAPLPAAAGTKTAEIQGKGERLIAPRRLGFLQKLVGLPRRAAAAGSGPHGVLPTEKAFDLDELGAQVWHLCDGRHTVAEIIRTFAQTRRVNQREAQVAVLAFLRMLVRRNLVAVAGARTARKKRRKK